jgi:hypothetical protein
MTNDDLGKTVPMTPAAEPQDQELEAASPQHEAMEVGNTTSTRDELWQAQFEPDAAREIAASHLGRLMYPSYEDWSRYVFHENEPHPYGKIRR